LFIRRQISLATASPISLAPPNPVGWLLFASSADSSFDSKIAFPALILGSNF
jgi:hypothetical protein